MSLRSPLGKVLGLGAAKEGAAHWWTQRVTSVGLLVLTPWLLISLLMLGDLSYDSVVPWIAAPLNTTLLSLLLVTWVYHAQLGVQVVIEDYVAHEGAKLLLMLAVDFLLIALGVLGVFSVLRIAFTTPGFN